MYGKHVQVGIIVNVRSRLAKLAALSDMVPNGSSLIVSVFKMDTRFASSAIGPNHSSSQPEYLEQISVNCSTECPSRFLMILSQSPLSISSTSLVAILADRSSRPASNKAYVLSRAIVPRHSVTSCRLVSIVKSLSAFFLNKNPLDQKSSDTVPRTYVLSSSSSIN